MANISKHSAIFQKKSINRKNILTFQPRPATKGYSDIFKRTNTKPGLFNLGADLAPSAVADEADVVSVKHYLSDLGEMADPDSNSVGFADQKLFSGIASFQRKNKLATGGAMRRNGPTEAKLEQVLRAGRFKRIRPLVNAIESGCRGVRSAIFGPILPGTPEQCEKRGLSAWPFGILIATPVRCSPEQIKPCIESAKSLPWNA